MARTEITITTVIDLDIKAGAAWFSALSDEEQVQFFNAVAEEAKSWPHHPDFQWCAIGEHLANCDCASAGARDMISGINGHMEHYLEEKEPWRKAARAPGPDAPAIDVHP